MPETACLHIQASETDPIRVVPLPGLSVRIGRAPFCEVRLTEPTVAEEEFQLRRRGASWHLVPVASPGSVTVDGRVVDRPRPIAYGVPLRVGNLSLTLRPVGASPPEWTATASAASTVSKAIPAHAVESAVPRLPLRHERDARKHRSRPTVEEREKQWGARWKAAGERLRTSAATVAPPPPAPERPRAAEPLAGWRAAELPQRDQPRARKAARPLDSAAFPSVRAVDVPPAYPPVSKVTRPAQAPKAGRVRAAEEAKGRVPVVEAIAPVTPEAANGIHDAAATLELLSTDHDGTEGTASLELANNEPASLMQPFAPGDVESTVSEYAELASDSGPQSSLYVTSPLPPSPLVGEGWGGGAGTGAASRGTPHPNPPPQGGREPEDAATGASGLLSDLRAASPEIAPPLDLPPAPLTPPLCGDPLPQGERGDFALATGKDEFHTSPLVGEVGPQRGPGEGCGQDDPETSSVGNDVSEVSPRGNQAQKLANGFRRVLGLFVQFSDEANPSNPENGEAIEPARAKRRSLFGRRRAESDRAQHVSELDASPQTAETASDSSRASLQDNLSSRDPASGSEVAPPPQPAAKPNNSPPWEGGVGGVGSERTHTAGPVTPQPLSAGDRLTAESPTADGQCPPPLPPLPKGGSYEVPPLPTGVPSSDTVRDPGVSPPQTAPIEISNPPTPTADIPTTPIVEALSPDTAPPEPAPSHDLFSPQTWQAHTGGWAHEGLAVSSGTWEHVVVRHSPRTIDDPTNARPTPTEHWPSARDILAACAAAKPAEPPRAAPTARKPRPKRPAPTVGLEPNAWTVPLWLGWLPMTLSALAAGIFGVALAWTWAQEAKTTAILANHLARSTPGAKFPLEPEELSAPSWWRGTAGGLTRRAIALASSDRPDMQEAQTVLRTALQASPLEPAARLAWVHLNPGGDEKAALVLSAGLSRDVLSLAWTGRQLLKNGQKDAALRAYQAALELAATADVARFADPVYNEDDPQARRYFLPGEDLIGQVVRDMAAQTAWTFNDWSEALPRYAVPSLVAARLLRDGDRLASDTALERITGSDESQLPPPGVSPAVHMAARAEAHALKGDWGQAQTLYQQAIDLTTLDRVKRSWQVNLADVALRLHDDSARQKALDAANNHDPNDPITLRVVELQKSGGERTVNRDRDAGVARTSLEKQR